MNDETSEFGGKADIPRKARKYSLEEDIFSAQQPPVPTVSRSRGVLQILYFVYMFLLWKQSFLALN